MKDFELKDYKVFELFSKQWAVVSAGSMEHHNGCTVSWGSLGTMWTIPGKKSGSIVTVYLYPTRYTRQLMEENDTFTVSFFPKEYKKAMGYMGSHSGRDEKKATAAGLTPTAIGDTVGYKEASLTFVCRKVYQHQMAKEDIAQDVQEYYAANPKAYPVDKNGEWHPHWVFVGEIIDVIGEII